MRCHTPSPHYQYLVNLSTLNVDCDLCCLYECLASLCRWHHSAVIRAPCFMTCSVASASSSARLARGPHPQILRSLGFCALSLRLFPSLGGCAPCRLSWTSSPARKRMAWKPWTSEILGSLGFRGGGRGTHLQTLRGDMRALCHVMLSSGVSQGRSIIA